MDLSGLPDKVNLATGGVDLTALPDDNAKMLREQYRATTGTPDDAAQVLDLTKRTGLPKPVVERNRREVERQAFEPDWNALQLTAPVTVAQLAANTKMFDLAHDDTENLRQIERTMGRRSAGLIGGPAFDRSRGTMQASIGPEASFSSIAYGLVNSFMQGAERERQGLRLQFADALGLDAMGAGALRRRGQAQFAEDLSTPEFDTATARGIYAGGASTLRNLPGLAASIITRNPVPGLAAAGVQTELDAYGKYRSRGASGGEALLGAAGEGAVEVATEMIPLRTMLGAFGQPGKTFAKEFAKSQVQEQFGEQAATILQDAIDTAIANPTKTWGDYLKERPDAAYQTFLATLVQSGVMTAGHTALAVMAGDEAKAAGAAKDAEALAQLSALAAASKLRARDPQTFQEFVAAASEDGPVPDVYLDARTLQQAGVDLAALAQASPAVAEQIAEALTNGGDLVIPVAEYATSIAGSALDPLLAPHLRTGEDALSLAESQTFYQGQAEAFQQAATRAMQERAEDVAWQQSAKAVEAKLFEELRGAGRFTDDVNSAYATLMRDFYVATASRLGLTPEEMFAQYPIRVAAARVAAEQRMDQEGPDAWLYKYYAARVWASEAEARENIKRRIIEDNERYGMFGKNDPALADGLVFTRAAGGKVKLKQKSAPRGNGPQWSGEAPEGSNAPVDWTATDNADRGTPESVMQEYGRGKGRIYQAWVPIGELPLPKGEDITNGYLDEDSGLRGELSHRGEPPPIKVRVSPRGKVELLDGNHRLAWYREVGYDNVAAYVIDERGSNPLQRLAQSVLTALGLQQQQQPEVQPAPQPEAPAGPTLDMGQFFQEGKPDLVITHNLTARNLLHALKMGGIPVPSLAVTKAEHPLLDFGEITLIGPKEMADPKGYANTKVFGADIYSPRYPSVEYQFTPNMRKRAEAMLKDGLEATKSYIDWSEVERRGVDTFRTEPAVRWHFLKDRGIEPTVVRVDPKPLPAALQAFAKDHRHQFDLAKDPAFIEASYKAFEDVLISANGENYRPYAEQEIADLKAKAEDRGVSYLIRDYARQVETFVRESESAGSVDTAATNRAIETQIYDLGLTDSLELYADEFLRDLNPNERIFQGHTYTGKRRYVAHTLENVVKILKKELRGGEGFNYGVGSIRSKFTPQFKSIKQIREAKDRLMDKATFEAVKDEVNADFFALVEKLAGSHPAGRENSLRFADSVTSMLYDAATMGIPRALRENGFGEVSIEGRQDIAEFLGKLRTMPTEYFEAKILRDVDLTEFSGAVVPEGVDPKVIEALNARGIKDIRYYKRNDDTDRRAKISEFEHLFFQGNRAEIAFGRDITQTPSVITLFNNADLSSFLHEMGHFQLEVLAHIAGQKDAPAEIVQDMERVLAWFGIKGDESVAGGETAGSVGQGALPDVEGLATELAKYEKLKTEREAKLPPGHRMFEVGERVLAAKKAELAAAIEARADFDKWFKQSKAVDAQGKPLVVYHGTTRDFTEFRRKPGGRALWAADTATANSYAGDTTGANVMPVYMSMQNPLVVDAEGATWQDIRFEGERIGADHLADLAEERGHDGLIIRNLRDHDTDDGGGIPADHYAVFNPEQIKSAIGNRGTFDPNDPNILRQEDAPLGADPANLPKRRTALEVWQAMSLEEKRPYHEMFARGFESYLFEGKAPSQELTSLFARFRSWLINVYKSIKALNVQISDDIRGVFDRLVATDEAIRQAEAARAMTPIFADNPEVAAAATEATATAVDQLQRRSLRDMRWLTNARGRILKQMQKDAKAKRKAVEQEVRAEVEATPVWQAKDFIKANPEADRDTVAEMFGFTSGDHLNKEIKAAGNRADLIAGMTDQRTLERYGDLTNPDTLARAVDEAIHNEARARFVATELKAISKATGPVRAITKAAKDFAAATIARKQVKAIKPNQHAAAETRAAKAAEKAMRAGDTVTAAVEKRNQLVQNYATRLSYDALDEIDKAVKYLRKFDSEGTRKNLDTEYVDQIDQLLERFDLRASVTNKAAEKRANLLAWVESQREQGFEPDIPPELLTEALRKPYRELTLEELRGLVDTVKQIEHLGRLKQKLLTAKDEREFKAIRDEIAASIEANAKGIRDLRTRNTTGAMLAEAGNRFLAMHRKMASVAREMDGFADGGPMWEYFIRSMNEAGDRETTMRAEATARLYTLVKPLVASGKMGGKGQFFPTLGGSYNREERIAIALNLGNAGNMQRMLDGEGWTMARLQPLLDTITPQEADFVQAVWDFFESYRPEIGAKERRIYGKEPNWVEPQPVTLGGKTLKGGYYPIKYDPARSGRAEAFADAEAAKAQMRGAYTTATTRRSFTKARAEEVTGRPLLYSFAGLYQGTNEVIHDLSWHEWLVDVNRLLRSLDGPIRTHYGAETVGIFKKAIEDIAAGDVPAQNVFERGLNHTRTGATIAGLGWNLMTSLLQPVGLTQSMVRIGPGWVVKGMSQWIKAPLDTLTEINSKSAMMASRAQTMQREINEIQNQVRGSKLDPVRSTFFVLIQKMQMVADVPTWLGAYEKHIAAGEAEARAVALADQAVLDAQGGGQMKDLSQIQRGHPALKLFTNFYSFFNVAYNLGVEQTKQKISNPKLYPSLALDYLLLYVLPAAFVTVMKEAIVGGGDDDEEKLVKKIIADQISYVLGLLVGLREVTAAVQKVAGVEQFKGSYGGPAGLRLFQEIDKLGQQIGQGEADMAAFKAANNVGGIIFHYPSGQINRSVEGVAAMVEGKTANPMAVVVGPPKP